VALCVGLGPRPIAIGTEWTGDEALARRIQAAVGPRPGTSAMAVALVSPGKVVLAGLGTSSQPDRRAVDEQSGFEIGSIAKAMNGMLLADLISADLVLEDTRVADIVHRPSIAGSPVGAATLTDLSQHISGLPRLAHTGPSGLLRMGLAQVTGANPYPSWSPTELLDAAARLDTATRGRFVYSNIGAAVLGHALAAFSGGSYADLLRDRLLTPLGMTSTHVLISASSAPARQLQGYSFVGQPREPWTGAGHAPAGGISSTAHDMARLLSGAIAGTAPGANATEPRRPTDEEDEQIGYGWFTTRMDGRLITWHNGSTGGFSSWIGFERSSRRGVVVLSASNREVGRLARHLLGVGPAPVQSRTPWPGFIGWWTIAMAVGMPLMLLYSFRQPGDRLARLNAIVGTTSALMLMWLIGAWLTVPWWVWSGATAIAGLAVLAKREPAPSRPAEGSSSWRLAGTALNLALCAWLIVSWSGSLWF
jgi:CubicO group peptidase (beta-lactamase class C family)